MHCYERMTNGGVEIPIETNVAINETGDAIPSRQIITDPLHLV